MPTFLDPKPRVHTLRYRVQDGEIAHFVKEAYLTEERLHDELVSIQGDNDVIDVVYDTYYLNEDYEDDLLKLVEQTQARANEAADVIQNVLQAIYQALPKDFPLGAEPCLVASMFR